MLRHLLLLLSVVSSFHVNAGHGFFNSFEGITWLVDPGLTPAQLLYPIDKASEQLQINFEKNPLTLKKIYMAFAEEKLAEGVSLLRRGDIKNYQEARKKYTHYLKALQSSFKEGDGVESTEYQKEYADRLLEHMYILSVEILSADISTHEYFLTLNKIASNHYHSMMQTLSRDFVGSHFFKKEEVKWSWELALEEK